MSDTVQKTAPPLRYGVSRKRLYAATFGVLLGGIVLAAAVFAAIRIDELDQARWEFERSSRDHVSALWKTLEMDFLVMRSVRSFYAGSQEVEPNEFGAFVAPLIKDHPSIRSMEWAPRLRGSGGKEAFPIAWVEPHNANVASLGHNLAFDPSCLRAIRQACDTGQIVMTSKLMMPNELGDQVGARVFLAVYKNNAPTASVEERRKNLMGFIVAVFRPKGIAEESLASLTPVGIDISLYDDSADPKDRLLYSYSSRTRILDSTSAASQITPPESIAASYSVKKEVAGRQWMVVCSATPQFFADRMTFFPWVGAGSVLLLAGLLAAYLLRRGRMAAKLAENERKLRGFLDQTFQFMGLLTPDGRLVEVNKTALDFAGLRKENVLNKLFWLTPWWTNSPQKQEQLRQAIEKAAAGYSVRFEVTHVTLDGSSRWIDTSLKPLKDDDGKVVYIVAEGYDITEHKLAVQRQERSIERLEQLNRLQEDLLSPGSLEEKFQKITDAAVHILDLDFCRIWMIEPGDLCRYGCINAALTEGPNICVNREKCLHLMASSGRYTHVDGDHQRIPLGICKIGYIASGPDKKFVTNHVTTDPRVQNHEWAKELGLVSFAGYKLRDTDGNAVGVLAMFAKHPVSDEEDAFLANLAEIASKTIIDCRAAEALRISERKHRLFAENVSDMIWAIDFTGKIFFISPSVTNNLGFTAEDYQTLSLPEIMTPASFVRANAELQRFASRGQDRRTPRSRRHRVGIALQGRLDRLVRSDL